MANKLIDPAPIIKKLADRCLEAKGIECSILGDLIDMLKAAPAENMTPVDAVEVVHGRWIEDSDLCTITCSECGKLWCIMDNDTDTFNYCPNCGAKMDAEVDK